MVGRRGQTTAFFCPSQECVTLVINCLDTGNCNLAGISWENTKANLLNPMTWFAALDGFLVTAKPNNFNPGLRKTGQAIYDYEKRTKGWNVLSNTNEAIQYKNLKNEVVTVSRNSKKIFINSTLLNKQKLRLENLKKTYGALDYKDFHPVGGKSVNDISVQMYNEMYADLQYTNWTNSVKNGKITEALATGSSAPTKVTSKSGSKLYKIAVNRPGENSFYWVTKDELDKLMANGVNTETKSGLPLGSMAEEYNIWEITVLPNKTARTYRSIIAGTEQRSYTTTGGATQTLVLDRSLWTPPTKINSSPFIPNF